MKAWPALLLLLVLVLCLSWHSCSCWCSFAVLLLLSALSNTLISLSHHGGWLDDWFLVWMENVIWGCSCCSWLWLGVMDGVCDEDKCAGCEGEMDLLTLLPLAHCDIYPWPAAWKTVHLPLFVYYSLWWYISDQAACLSSANPIFDYSYLILISTFAPSADDAKTEAK